MDYVKIGGRVYDVLVTGLSETFNILHTENAGRTMAVGAPMALDPLGTFFGHTVTFVCKSGHEKEYDELFDYVAVPRADAIPVQIVHGQKTISYPAYVSTGTRSLKRIDKKTGKVYWDEFELNITPISAQVIPE